ncbi:MAG: hypothetical protein H6613_18785 [Ignavibacteriales bacterium]|nr:hypothetical protein [Ignavibacteriales bacterium]
MQLLFFIFVFSLLAFTFYGPNYNGTGKPILLGVPKGSSFNSVVDSLLSKKIIPSKMQLKTAAFYLVLKKILKPEGMKFLMELIM